MTKLRKNQRREVTRFVEYIISGGAYFWSGYAMFFALDKGLHWSLWWAKLSANVFGWTINYLLQRYWVFNNPSLAKHKTKVTGRYIFITLVDFMMDYLIVAGFKLIGITTYIGQFVSSGFFSFLDYLWFKILVFPEKFTKSKFNISFSRVVAHP